MYIQNTYLVDGRLDADHQYAVRVLASRHRELHRCVLVRSRPESDLDRKRADIELHLLRRDHGEVFRWFYGNHGIGRLDCPACDSDYTDGPLGIQKKVSLTRLCIICGQGVQHCRVVDSQQDALQALRAFWDAVGVAGTEEVATEALQADVGGTLYCCDACYGWQFERLQ